MKFQRGGFGGYMVFGLFQKFEFSPKDTRVVQKDRQGQENEFGERIFKF